MEGWIKIHRRLLESGFWNDSYAVHLWVHLLLHASYEPRKTFFNGKIVQLKVGQLITGRKKLSQETGISEQIIRKWLDLFEINQQLTIEKTNAGSCISILNFKFYQQDNQRSTTKLTNNQPTVNQQPTNDQPLYKEIEEGKEAEEVKKEVVNKFTPPQLFDVIDYFTEKGFPIELAKRAFEFYDTANWIDSKGNKVKNWKQKMLSVWLKPENKTQQNGQSKHSRQSATIDVYKEKYAGQSWINDEPNN